MTAQARSERERTVAVVGSGFSGLLTAIHLLAADPGVTVRLIEKAAQFGRGRAYEPGHPDHPLNVRASNMSAFPDRPSHLLDWLRADAGLADPNAFISRRKYGDYLQDLLRAQVSDPAAVGRLLLEQDEAVGVSLADGGYDVRLALGRSLFADAVVLAVGLGAPGRPQVASADVLSCRNYHPDPWQGDLADLPGGDILVLGSGLTMFDVALSLDRPDRTLTVISRHGLLPRTHAAVPPTPAPEGALDRPLTALRTMRAHAAAVGWRGAIDSIRPATVATWQGWSLKERRRFLRHLQPWWDVHRHRTSPAAVERLAPAFLHGRVSLLAGRVEALEPVGSGLRAAIRPRGRTDLLRRDFAAVVICAGLSGDFRTSRLLADLHRQGLLHADPLGLGVDVDDEGRLRRATGQAASGLYAVGPLTRGAFWEAVAVPDLRSQTARLARTVLADLTGAAIA